MKLLELLKEIPVLEANVSMDLDIGHVAYDSRKVEQGSLFVAVSGFAADGNRFIPMALEKGAAAVLCERCEGDFPAIVVPDTRIALGKIANGERHRIGMKVVGVTGSVGKSTTKEMISTVLESTFRTAKTLLRYSACTGLPLMPSHWYSHLLPMASSIIPRTWVSLIFNCSSYGRLR